MFLEEVQDKLLTEYEQELKTSTTRHAKKDSSASDDWEKVLVLLYTILQGYILCISII